MNLDPQHLLLLIALAVLAHILLVALYRAAHPVMLLTMAFAVVSMLSTATLLPAVDALKWARLYVTVLAVIIGMMCVRPGLLGGASWALLIFAILYVLAALWSAAPLAGLMFKGLFLITLMLGLAAVFVARDIPHLWRLQRCMIVAAAAVTAALLLAAVATPGALVPGARFSVLGLNPNRIGETLAPLLIFCCFGLLYEPARSWRLACYGVALPAAALLLATGSRAGFGQVMLGFVVLMLPLVSRPWVFLGMMTVVGVGGMMVLGVIEDTRAIQLGAYDLASRRAPWGPALAAFREHPVIGIGWAFRESAHGYSSTNVHSIYVQVLVEMGLLGIIALLTGLAWTANHALKALRATAGEPTARPFVYLAAALLVAVAGHGVAESGALMGSSLNAACLGISAALVDWILVSARARSMWVMNTPDPPLWPGAATEPHRA